MAHVASCTEEGGLGQDLMDLLENASPGPTLAIPCLHTQSPCPPANHSPFEALEDALDLARTASICPLPSGCMSFWLLSFECISAGHGSQRGLLVTMVPSPHQLREEKSLWDFQVVSGLLKM